MPDIDPYSVIVGLLAGWFAGSLYYGVWKQHKNQ